MVTCKDPHDDQETHAWRLWVKNLWDEWHTS